MFYFLGLLSTKLFLGGWVGRRRKNLHHHREVMKILPAEDFWDSDKNYKFSGSKESAFRWPRGCDSHRGTISHTILPNKST